MIPMCFDGPANVLSRLLNHIYPDDSLKINACDQILAEVSRRGLKRAWMLVAAPSTLHAPVQADIVALRLLSIPSIRTEENNGHQ